jgi:hypothetical protein
VEKKMRSIKRRKGMLHIKKIDRRLSTRGKWLGFKNFSLTKALSNIPIGFILALDKL